MVNGQGKHATMGFGILDLRFWIFEKQTAEGILARPGAT